jgi:hypothetical protein
VDFQKPTIDGGDPILNFPGRLFDAERRGCSFEVIGKRNRCKVFRLIEEPDVEVGRGGPRDEGSNPPPSPSGQLSSTADLSAEQRLFEPPPMSHYNPMAEAA